MHSPWTTAKLGTIASVVASNVDKHVHEDEIPIRLCNYLDVYRNRRLSKPYHFSQGSVTQAELDRFYIRKGDVLITKDSETPDDIGVPCLIAEDFENTVCGYHLALIRAKEVLNPSFLSYLFESEATRRYFLAKAAGLTRFGLNARIIRGVPTPMPPPDEQAAIANVLDAVEWAISNTRAVITKAEHLQKGMMQQLLTGRLKTDGTLRSNNELRETKLGFLPSHWQLIKAKDCCLRVTDGTHDTPKPSKEGHPLLTSKNLTGDGISLLDAYLISKEDFDAANQRSKVEQFDVLYGMIGTIGNPEIVEELDVQFAAKNVGIFKTGANQVLALWLRNYLRSPMYLLHLHRQQAGTTQQFISLGYLRKLLVPFPVKSDGTIDWAEVRSINDSLQTVEHFRQAKRRKITALQRLKKSLMQNLLTGRIRLKLVGSAEEVKV